MTHRQVANLLVDIIDLCLDAFEGVERVSHWVAGAAIRGQLVVFGAHCKGNHATTVNGSKTIDGP